MHRLSLLASSVVAGSLWLVPAAVHAAPPSLPEPEVEEPPPAEPAPTGDLTADGQPMPTEDTGTTPEADAGFDSSTEAELDTSSGFDGETTGDAASDVSMGAVGDDGPGMVMGRKEPTMQTLRGPSGLFYTSLPGVGELYSVRFHLHSDFFVKKDFFCCEGGGDGDRHARVRGSVNLGFTFTKWTEAYFSINNSANRNTRDQGARQDPPTVFALGDLAFGVKGGYAFKDGGIGVGGQIGLSLLSGSERLRTARVGFDIAAIVGVDLRYLTAKHVPVRITGNLGWTLDNSHKLVDWGAIDDPLSREVLRFSSGVNHSRVTTKLAVDFPIRLGKDKQIGLDPVLEYSWDISTYKEQAFVELTEQYGASPLKRSQSWLTLGLRANVWHGLFLNAAVDVGTTSPSYEYGPPVAPYQVILGLGWSIDPKPRIKEVGAPIGNDLPPAVLEGRVVGRVTDSGGNPVADAKVSFPDLASNVLLTDSAGMFTSFRFPEGVVVVRVEFGDGSTVEQMADIRPGEDTQIDIVAEGAALPAEPVFDGTFVNEKGEPIAVSVGLDGMGIQESFISDASGRIAIALPLGEYKATLTAEGYTTRDVAFVMTAEGVIMTETLTSTGASPGGGTPLISGTKSKIKLKKPIKFNGSDLDTERSTEVLDQLAAFLSAHPEYVKVEVRVHTDDKGNPNMRSQSRADQVVDYLSNKGVDRARLVAKGYGAKDPVAVNITSEGRAQNNRSEIKVKDYDESKAPAGATE